MKFTGTKHSTHKLFAILLLGFIFTFHTALPVYVSSNFLSTFASTKTVGLIYSIASLMAIIVLLQFPRLLRRFGNYETLLLLIGLDALSLAGLISFKSIWWIAPFFVVNIVMIALASLTIDIFLEHSSDNKHTGGIRGLFLTVINIAWIISPFLTGLLVQETDYQTVYIAALVLLVPLLMLLVYNFRDFKDPRYTRIGTFEGVEMVRSNPKFRSIFSVNIILNTFYGWMVIYTPLYLHNTIGFDWPTIGIIFTIMLLPYIIFELPLGRLADSHFGEKELMIAGFIIIATFTALLAVIEVPNVFLWALALFMTRVGAAIAEVMIETYFFKQIHERDSAILGLFRTTRPLGYLLAPILATITFAFVEPQYSFIVLGAITLFGVGYSLELKDTK